MVRASDLQDNLSKTQAVERIFDSLRQRPDNEQRQFAQQVQQNLMQQNESVEQLKSKDELKLSTNLEKERSREEKEPGVKKKRKEKEEEKTRGKSSDSNIDIIV